MKLKTIQLGAALVLLLAGGSRAQAQSHVPGPSDYEQFSRFIASRNIFDPNRYPHTTERYIHHIPHPVSSRSPAFSFVGAMAYQKGLFAFFDGTSSEYRKALQVADTNKIAGFTVQEITLAGVTLTTEDRTNFLPVGFEMRQGSDGIWVTNGESAGFATNPAESGSSSGSASSQPSSSGSSTDMPAPPASSDANTSDVLKRLMQLRQQENK